MSVSIVLSTPKAFHCSSWAIRQITCSDVSHASVHFDGDGSFFSEHRWVYEAVSQGVRLVPIERWQDVNVERYRLKFVDTFCGIEALSRSLFELGAAYDFAGVGKFAFYLALQRLNLSAANWAARSTADTLFCSEAVLRVVQVAASISLDPETFGDVLAWNPDLTSPEDLKKLRRCQAFSVAYANPG